MLIRRHYSFFICFFLPLPTTHSILTTTTTNLSNKSRQKIRKSGRCVKGCGFGYSNTITNTNPKSNSKYKTIQEFTNLLENYNTFLQKYKKYKYTKIANNSTLPAAEERFGKNNAFSFDSIFEWCRATEKSFEYCMERTKEILIYEQAVECYTSCMEQDMDNVEFENSAIAQQEFEVCLDNYSHENVSFDYQELQSTNKQEIITHMKKAYKSYGYILINNMFPIHTMNHITNILNAWRKLGTWEDLEFSRYSYDQYIMTSANRFEVVLPFKEPFVSLASFITSNSVLQELFFTNKTKVDIVSATASLPGAIQQTIHRTSNSDDRLKKMVFIILPHDVKNENGPRIVCPCTHSNTRLFHFYSLENDDLCPLKSDTELKAGTMVVQDDALLQYSDRNYGNVVRWNIEISFDLEGSDDDFRLDHEDVMKHIDDYRDTM